VCALETCNRGYRTTPFEKHKESTTICFRNEDHKGLMGKTNCPLQVERKTAERTLGYSRQQGQKEGHAPRQQELWQTNFENGVSERGGLREHLLCRGGKKLPVAYLPWGYRERGKTCRSPESLRLCYVACAALLATITLSTPSAYQRN